MRLRKAEVENRASRAENPQAPPISEALERELTRLKNLLGLGAELRLRWIPDQLKLSKDGLRLSGEVKGSTIHIYEEDEREALETLLEEVVEYAITEELEKPYVALINHLVEAFNEVQYARRHRLMEKLRRLMAV